MLPVFSYGTWTIVPTHLNVMPQTRDMTTPPPPYKGKGAMEREMENRTNFRIVV